MMTDAQLLATTIADEAGDQPYEGMVAVGIVIRNRMALHYASDGTVAGTVLWHFQFSGFWFSTVDGQYVQSEFDQDGAMQQAQRLFAKFSASLIWPKCLKAVTDSTPKSGFRGGSAFTRVQATPRALLYLNPSIVTPPDWASPENKISQIYDHVFYRG